MPPRRIATFIGTRPEAIKMAPVIAALERAADLEPVVVNTGQHRELIDQVIELFEISVNVDLALMQPDQSLATLTSRLIAGVDESLQSLQPEMVLVQGDTTTVLATALAAFYRHIPIGHVEAGLRTGNLQAPFPEEANRKLTTALAALHFAPTDRAAANLRREHVDDTCIFVTGNTVIDALQLEVARQQSPSVREPILARLRDAIGTGFGDRPFVLVTGHRRENFGDGFDQICTAIASLAERFRDHLFVYPVHLNPRVHGVVHQRLAATPNVRLIAPQPYGEFVALLAGCRVVLTDSGGVQEEAPSLGKPVLVMRETTERPEGVSAGTVQLVGANTEAIVAHVSQLLEDEAAYRGMSEAVNPYGDGQAAPRIVEAIQKYFR